MFVEVIEKHQGACVEGITYRNEWMGEEKMVDRKVIFELFFDFIQDKFVYWGWSCSIPTDHVWNAVSAEAEMSAIF